MDETKDASLLDEYLKNLDSKTLKELWKTKKVQEKMNKRQQSQIMRNRYNTEEEFIDALENGLRTSRTHKECAAKLNITTQTLRKWGKIYFKDLYFATANYGGKGVQKNLTMQSGRYPLQDILDGKYPDYGIRYLTKRLIRHKVIPWECSVCHFGEGRTLPGDKLEHRPILLDFIDRNSRNHRPENLRFLCYNHYYLLVGNIVGRYNNHLTLVRKTFPPTNMRHNLVKHETNTNVLEIPKET